MLRTFAAIGSLVIASAALARPALAQGVDSIIVTSVQPSGPLHRGVPTKVSLELDVTLNSMDAGDLMLGFNTQGPKQYPRAANVPVKRGKQHVTLAATVAAVDWSSQGAKFAYVVNIRSVKPTADARGRSPGFGTVRGTIDVVP